MTGPELFLVFARAQNGVIGAKGRLPWHVPADLAHFKRLTMGTPMIMGRATFDSLPGVLPGRRHIVLTRDPDWNGEDAEIAQDMNSAIHLANAARIAVIGGGDVFAQALPLARRIEMTEIHRDYDGDVTMPALPEAEWEEAARTDFPADGSRPAYSFVTLRRKS